MKKPALTALGADGGGLTHTSVKTPDFESGASANSATSACGEERDCGEIFPDCKQVCELVVHTIWTEWTGPVSPFRPSVPHLFTELVPKNATGKTKVYRGRRFLVGLLGRRESELKAKWSFSSPARRFVLSPGQRRRRSKFRCYSRPFAQTSS